VQGASPHGDADGDDRRERVEETTETELLREDGDFCEVPKMRTPPPVCICIRLCARASVCTLLLPARACAWRAASLMNRPAHACTGCACAM
jgi:hypothetical protein